MSGGSYCSHCGRSCGCTSTATWPHSSFATAATTSSWDSGWNNWTRRFEETIESLKVEPLARAVNDPWYGDFRERVEDINRLALIAMAVRPRRAQARQCGQDARRWKRRRFVQKLRGLA